MYTYVCIHVYIPLTTPAINLHNPSFSQDTAELFFDDVRLPTSSILGGEAGVNRGFYYLMQELPLERLEIADLGLASAEWMFEETREYVKQRKAFKKTIADLQVSQQALAM